MMKSECDSWLLPCTWEKTVRYERGIPLHFADFIDLFKDWVSLEGRFHTLYCSPNRSIVKSHSAFQEKIFIDPTWLSSLGHGVVDVTES